MFYWVCVRLVQLFMLFMFRVKCIGKKNVPKKGGAILAINHKSAFDPLVVGITAPRRLFCMAKAELFKNKLLGALLRKLGAFPVHRGSGDVSAFKTAFKILDDGGAMLIFPEGRRVKKGDRRHAKTGVVMIAQKKTVPVIPVYIDGDYKWMKKITVTYGEPVSFEEYKEKKLSAEEVQALADGVLDKIYSLAQGE